MDAPKCRLCGNRHWAACEKPTTFNGRTLIHPGGKAVQAADLVAGKAYTVTLNHPQPPVLTSAVPGTFDRNAYQREYMRKRRAAAKSKD